MIDGQMTIEEVIADIQGDGVGYIIVKHVAYEDTLQVSREGKTSIGPSQVYLSRYEAEEAARAYNSRTTSGEVWEIDLSAFQLRVMPAEKPASRGESGNG